MLAASDSIMNNLLLGNLPYYVPDIDPHEILEAGAAGIEGIYSGKVLQGVRHAYLDGLRGSWALGIALLGVTVLCSFAVKLPGRLALKGIAEDGGRRDMSSKESEKRTAVVNA